MTQAHIVVKIFDDDRCTALPTERARRGALVEDFGSSDDLGVCLAITSRPGDYLNQTKRSYRGQSWDSARS